MVSRFLKDISEKLSKVLDALRLTLLTVVTLGHIISEAKVAIRCNRFYSLSSVSVAVIFYKMLRDFVWIYLSELTGTHQYKLTRVSKEHLFNFNHEFILLYHSIHILVS